MHRDAQYSAAMIRPCDRLRELRERAGFDTAADAARRFGWNENTYRSHENGARDISRKAAAKYAKAFGVAAGDILYPSDGDESRLRAEPLTPRIPERNISPPFDLPLASGRRIPILGQALGGEEGIFLFNGEAVDWIVAPHALENVPGAYGVYVSGSSMEPRYFPGETLLVHPHKPVARGDFVVVQTKGDNETVPHGFVKQFVTWTPTRLILRQYNPDKEIEIERKDVVSVHKIVGTQNGL
mgnify:CR=1 FL=1